jgi:hypothetical protein
MKRVLFIASVLLIALVAQVVSQESNLYYVNVPIIKVYAHQEGYMVVYKVGSTKTATAYLPMRWFVAGGKGEIDYGWGSMFPYMTVFYKDQKFGFLRLHLNSDTNDSRWGIFDQFVDGKKLFEGVEDIKLVF